MDTPELCTNFYFDKCNKKILDLKKQQKGQSLRATKTMGPGQLLMVASNRVALPCNPKLSAFCVIRAWWQPSETILVLGSHQAATATLGAQKIAPEWRLQCTTGGSAG